jgi:hypothetical protein
VVGDLQFLVDFGVAAAVQHCLLTHPSHEALLVLHVDCGPVLQTQTAVVLPDALVGRVLVVVETSDVPCPVRGRQDESLEESDFLQQSQVHIALLFILLISRDELILIGQVAGHEGQANGEGHGQWVVAVLERVWLLVKDEVSVVLESAPVEYHHYMII